MKRLLLLSVLTIGAVITASDKTMHILPYYGETQTYPAGRGYLAPEPAGMGYQTPETGTIGGIGYEAPTAGTTGGMGYKSSKVTDESPDEMPRKEAVSSDDMESSTDDEEFGEDYE